MDANREDGTAQFKGLWTGAPWVPATPAKPDSSHQHQQLPIPPNWQVNHPGQSNWLEAGLLTRVSEVTQENGVKPARLPGDYINMHSINGELIWQAGEKTGPLQSIDTWQASKVNDLNIYGANFVTGNKASIDDSEPWDNMSFGSLLSMAHAASNRPPLVQNEVTFADFMSPSTTFAPGFHPGIGSSQNTTSFGNSSGPELDSSLGTTYESAIPSRPFFFDLNAPPTITANAAFSEGVSFPFEPITPEKTKQVEYGQESSMQFLSTDDEPVVRDATEDMPSGAAKVCHEKKEKAAVQQKNATPLTKGQENNKPDKGQTEEPDLIKTPQQRQRRRKHRPKVIIEGQTKTTPKQRARPASVSHETTVKKKYARRKGVNSPAEKNETGSNMDASTSKHTPAERRKHARTKGINEQEATMEKMSTDSANLNTTRLTRRSCRRSLNFNSEDLVSDYGLESQAGNFKAKVMETIFIDVNVFHDLTHSTDQGLEGYLSGAEKDSPSLFQNRRKDSQPDYGLTAQKLTRGKCQIVFSDVTHDKEANTIEVTVGPHNQQTPQNYSICSSTNFSEERDAKILKRRLNSTSAEAEVSSSNATGMFYNFEGRHLSLFSKSTSTSGMHFPNICKKRRTQKVLGATNSSLLPAITAFGNQVKLGKHTLSNSATGLLMNNHSANNTRTAHRNVRDLLGHTGRVTKKRSKGYTRVRNLASLQEFCKQLKSYPIREETISKNKLRLDIVHRPHTCLEALVADTCSKMMTKKRSKRAINSGTRLALTWKSMYSINDIIDQLDQLDLNAQSSQASEISAQNRKLLAYYIPYQEQSALVPYQRSGALIPFDGSFDQFRRKQPRPKVDLDEETTRVWKLLLEDINSEGIDGTDKDKTKWWEEERRVFKGRADSFIARMHLIQGDRRFSPWKGSVVDSVVGVFLTQNVSDHLSSSAFMSVVARFPPNPETDNAEFPEVESQTDGSLPEVCVWDADEPSGLNKIISEPAHGRDSKIPEDLQDDEVRLVNNLEFSGKSTEDSVAIDNLSAQLPDMSNSDPVMSHESAPNKSSSLIAHGLNMDDAVSSQNSADSPIAQTNEITEPSSLSNSEVIAEGKTDSFTSSTSFVKLLQMAGTVIHGVYGEGLGNKELHTNQKVQPESLALKSRNEDQHVDHVSNHKSNILCSEDTMSLTPNLEADAGCLDLCNKNSKLSDTSESLCTVETSGLSVELASQTALMKIAACSSQEGPAYFSPEDNASNDDKIEVKQNISEKKMDQGITQNQLQENFQKKQTIPDIAQSNDLFDSIESSSNIGSSRRLVHTEVELDTNDPDYNSRRTSSGSRSKGGKEKQNPVDWDSLRKQAEEGGRKRGRTANTMDSVDWDAVRCADVNEIAQTIKERGMNNMLAERIKAFLNRIFQEHGSIDLEWLRDVPPDKAKEYLLSIRGLGLKSVECVRLLTLHHLAFPVDTNVGRIAVRLGWVPLQPLPESLQLHLLELYPILESIQKYLWPRLCKLDQKTLYELHYQMITFGKVFCTKSKPNCNACPLRAECRHFASAFASARLALPAPEERSIVKITENLEDGQDSNSVMNTLQLPSIPPMPDEMNILSAAEYKAACQISVRGTDNLRLYSSQANATDTTSGVNSSQPIIEEPTSPEPIIELPTTPETECTYFPECDIEDTFCEDSDEIPTINFNMEQFTQNLQKVMRYSEIEEGDMSKALVALKPEVTSIPMPKLKNMSRLRTEHQVYELPDSHPLLEGMDKREPDDPSPYLLAIWSPGETVDSIKPPERQCGFQGNGKLCIHKTCLSCNSIREQKSQTVRGTLLIPCRTAMRGSFPLNGTYFQVNEVFSDHESSMTPIDVPRQWLWNLPRRTVYFGTSIPTIFKGLTTAGIQYCFWRGFVCVRGFDRNTRAPRPLVARFHFPASKLVKGKGKIYDE